MKYKTELLAPAGCFPSLQAGIKAGADAVYFGVAQLNMRARARRSFQLSDIGEILNICHENRVKGYLTLNTLLYDYDANAARKILEAGKENNVDAVILADMAAVQMANELGLEVHLSTQLSISNYETVKFYAPLCERIVLARELNLKMIKHIHEQMLEADLRGKSGRPMELEAFAHGALCIAVSGRCGMSLHTSNASASRGACEQNCRKEYIVTDKETGQQLEIDNNFVMSPNDISTIDFLDQVLDAGIHTLKIEGRGRSPEYVDSVIRSYRKAIDALNDDRYTQELVEGLQGGLEKVYNRGHSDGYYLGRKQGWSQTYGSKATRQKIEVGKVSNFFNRVHVAEITATTGELKIGDEYTIIGENTGVVSGVVEEIRVDEQAVEGVKGHCVFSIKVQDKVRRGDRLYLMKVMQP
ncbi:MAG TPA: collagenase-like protease [Verrucomicrobiales bacterium]|nr:U32 family peptidase [Verrucomicrobiae bacterium]HAO67554.1 collagenase-like protease [Verrucomicrobiales bacterium]HAQ97722.1 collagenase-like protease [Verrucomicrobiales bacterium]HBP55709.1 collagenase-like protease [Verrucomicrobiales bacterium]HCP38105.1 collagenase-like protease [Verrucomicrobiales bacterium]|tara:strand:- start:7923 stop:9161 length:1239 start_codon:yes stop_codon:yes gene_type:complete